MSCRVCKGNLKPANFLFLEILNVAEFLMFLFFLHDGWRKLVYTLIDFGCENVNSCCDLRQGYHCQVTLQMRRIFHYELLEIYYYEIFFLGCGYTVVQASVAKRNRQDGSSQIDNS